MRSNSKDRNSSLVEHVQATAQMHPERIAIVQMALEGAPVSVSYGELACRISERKEELSFSAEKADNNIHLISEYEGAEFLVEYLAVQASGGVAVLCAEPLGYTLPTLPSDTANVLYTSGTTGRRKGVAISHRTIEANVQNLLCSQPYTEETIFIICGGMDHLGCLSKVWATLSVGGTLVLLHDGLKDVNALFRALDWQNGDGNAMRRFATFLVPGAIRMLLRFSKARLAQYSERIAFIETGADALSSADMLSLRQTLPHSRLFNTYASTEGGIVATYDFSQGECSEGCVGKALKNSTIGITEDGRIVCGGDTVMSGYVNEEGFAPSHGKIVTNDNGRTDTEGNLYITGRTDDIINVSGYKVSPVEVENAALELDFITECLCLPAEHPVLGKVLRLLYVANVAFGNSEKEQNRFIAKHLSGKLEHYKVPMYYKKVDKIARTATGKPDRKSYVNKYVL